MSTIQPEELEVPQENSTSTAEVVRSGSAGGKNTRNIVLIIQREYKARVKQRSFIVVTVIMMLLIIIAASFPTFLAVLSSQSQTSLTVVNDAGNIAGLSGSSLHTYIDKSLNVTYDSTGTPQATPSNKKPPFAITMGQSGDENALRQQVRDGKISVLLTINRSTTNDLSFTYYTNASLSQNSDLAQVQAMATQLNTLDKLSRLGVSPTQQQTLFVPTTFTTVSTLQQNTGRTPTQSAIASFVAIIGIVLIYITLQMYGSSVASGVAEEKGSRIMELLINAATPFQLLMGKIIGIGLVGFTQIGLIGIVGAAAFLIQTPIQHALLGTSSGLSLDFTGVSLDILGLVVIYFVLGFLLYATLYAAAGTLVSRQEEVGTSVAPLNFLVIAGYLAGFYTAFSPNATWVKVLSYIPFFTPMVMLGREGAAPLAWWEILLSCAIMVAAILICAWIAARIYRVGVLMYGQKPGFGPYLKQLRARRNTVQKASS